MAMQHLTDTEEIIMECVWTATEEVTFAVIISAAKEKFNKEWKRQTVSTYLSHLVQKGYLDHCRRGKGMFYFPVISRDEYVKTITKGFLNFWYTNRPQLLVANLAENKALSEKDVEELGRLVKES